MSIAFLAITILAVGLVSAVAAEPISVTSATAAIVGIVFVMVISAAVRIAKTQKKGHPSRFAVNSANVAIMLAMIAVNARYLYTTKSSIVSSPQKLYFVKNNGFLRKV